MECLFCDKNLHEDVATEFVCICNKCLDIAEKSEERMVKMICEIRDMLKQEQYDRKMEKRFPITASSHDLLDADPNCQHEIENKWSGVKCKKCGGWFCY